MRIKSSLGALYRGIFRVCKNIKILSKGQSENYAILQTAHRLEKGLCVSKPRKLWGFEKAEILLTLILKEKQKNNSDLDAINIGMGALAAYIMYKSLLNDQEEIDKLSALKDKINKCGLSFPDGITNFGGVRHLSRLDFPSEGYDKLFLSRHSIRDFDDSPVSINIIIDAVELALRAPSACNRQANQVYVISAEDRIKAGSQNDFNADKYLIVSGNIRAFSLNEQNDWIVSASIFAGYLSLALHAKGIGACVIRKDIVEESTYCKNLRKMLSIPEDEQIVIEFAIGNYKEWFDVPISHRIKAKDIIHLSPSL